MKKTGYKPDQSTIMEKETYEASESQLQFWLTHYKNQLAGKPAELLSLKFIKDKINVPALEKSIASVIQRHESLRTSFSFLEGQLIQNITPYDEKHFGVVYHDIKEGKDHDLEVDLITEKENKCLNDLQSTPLIKAYIFHLGNETYLFKLFLNHIIADIPSLSLLRDEINTFYKSYINHEEVPLPELKIQLKDYIKQQNKNALNKKESLKKFWISQIGSLAKVINWKSAFHHYNRATGHLVNTSEMTDHTTILNALENGNTAAFGLKLDEVFYDGLENISLNSKTGISSTLYTSLFILFYLIDHQEEILIASPVSLRASTPSLSAVIANLDAGIYLKGSLSDQLKCSDVLAKTYTDFIKSYRKAITSHENLDLDKRLLRANCSVYLNFQHNGITGKPNKVAFSEGHHVSGDTSYMLTYEATQTQHGYDCKWYYNTTIFPAAFIEWIALVHKEILCAMIKDQDITVSELRNEFNFSHP